MRIFSDNASEWQIDAVGKYAKMLKEEEIEHSSLPPEEKENRKRLWKELIEGVTGRFKELMGRVGRIRQEHFLF